MSSVDCLDRSTKLKTAEKQSANQYNAKTNAQRERVREARARPPPESLLPAILLYRPSGSASFLLQQSADSLRALKSSASQLRRRGENFITSGAVRLSDPISSDLKEKILSLAGGASGLGQKTNEMIERPIGEAKSLAQGAVNRVAAVTSPHSHQFREVLSGSRSLLIGAILEALDRIGIKMQQLGETIRAIAREKHEEEEQSGSEDRDKEGLRKSE